MVGFCGAEDGQVRGRNGGRSFDGGELGPGDSPARERRYGRVKELQKAMGRRFKGSEWAQGGWEEGAGVNGMEVRHARRGHMQPP